MATFFINFSLLCCELCKYIARYRSLFGFRYRPHLWAVLLVTHHSGLIWSTYHLAIESFLSCRESSSSHRMSSSFRWKSSFHRESLCSHLQWSRHQVSLVSNVNYWIIAAFWLSSDWYQLLSSLWMLGFSHMIYMSILL